MKKTTTFLSTLALAALSFGCAHHRDSAGGDTGAAITGTVTFPGTLPAGAVLSVFLVENTWTSEAITVLNTDVNESPGPSPVAFRLQYDPAEIEADSRYTVGARVSTGGKVVLQSNGFLVLTRGGPTNNITLPVTPLRK